MQIYLRPEVDYDRFQGLYDMTSPQKPVSPGSMVLYLDCADSVKLAHLPTVTTSDYRYSWLSVITQGVAVCWDAHEVVYFDLAQRQGSGPEASSVWEALADILQAEKPSFIGFGLLDQLIGLTAQGLEVNLQIQISGSEACKLSSYC